MKRKIMTGFTLMLAVLLAGLTVSGTAAFAAESSDSKVLARIGEVTITDEDLAKRVEAMPPFYKAGMESGMGKKAIVEIMVNLSIYSQEARAEKIDQDERVKMKIEELTNSLLAKEYVQRKGLLSPEVKDEEVEQYYKEHGEDFVKPASVKMSEILVRIDDASKDEQVAAAREKAIKIKSELKQGADFAKLAVDYSDDKMTGPRGGRMGHVTQKQIMPDLAEPAFSMKPGEISNPIQTEEGFYIIKVDDKREAGKVELEDAKERIVPILMKAKEKNEIEKETERLKKKYNVRIYIEDIGEDAAPTVGDE